jgi:ATP-dependent RNA helicase SUPV3L1/SUV3
VVDEVKALDQPARATLRKYGVRFGAYHIYLPALLKPAPRKLATQLWSLRHDGTNGKVLEELLHLAGSGRTSIAADPAIDPALYRPTGYRACGTRAVRVDILERLADLIRPALAWRESAQGSRPSGAIAGGGFIVVNAMTSLIGASGEDFASVLRALGYRMERRPKPPEPALPSTGTTPGTTEAAAPAETIATAPDGEPGSVQAVTPIGPADAATGEAGEAGEAGVDAAAAAAPAQSPAAAVEDAAGVASAVASPAAEPQMIEVWRPGRIADRRRVRARQRGRAKQIGTVAMGQASPPSAAPEPVAAALAQPNEGAPASAPTGENDVRPRQSMRPRGREYRMERQEERQYRQKRDRPPGKRFEPREKRPDPNSPFAKLAALKAQLEADAKERR